MAEKKSTSLGADATLLTFSKVATSGIAMVMTMLLSRFRTLEEYGTYSQILMVVNLVTSILMLGFPKSLNYFLAKTDAKEEKQKFLSLYYTLNTILSFLVGGALVLSVGLIEKYFDNYTIRGFLYFLALFPWTKIVCSSVENLLIVYKKPKMLVAFRIINGLALLLSVMVVQWFGWTFKDYMLIYVLVEAAFSVAVYLIAAKVSGGIRPYLSTKMMKTVFAFSIPLGLASVVGTLNVELDKLLIGALMDTESFAVYSNAAKELPVTMIASSFTAVLLPQMVKMLKKEDRRGAIKLWGNATTLSMVLIAVIGVGCFVYAEDVIKILYSEKYIEGVWVFRLYSLHLLMRCTYYGMVLNSIGKTGFIFWCSIGALGSNAALNLVLFKIFELFGQSIVAPAVATLISTTSMAILQLAVTAKSLDIRFRDVFPWKQSAGILLVNIAFGVVFWGIKAVSPLDSVFSGITLSDKPLDGSVIESVILGCVWAIAYFAVMFKTIKKKWRNLKVKD
ncbi:MAG: polysaccharide biosynthesis protein [Clostridia bacterium]|nr:polysaccharide biosynthesis protein [Clostridia bacterium]